MKKTRPNRQGVPEDFSKFYSRLKPFYEKTKKGKAAKGHHFSNCVSASLAKAYEFNVLANTSNEKLNAFFLTAGLRSICEDLIILRYLGALSEENRNEFIETSMCHEVLTNLRAQKQFFSENRAIQIVLDPPNDFEAEIGKSICKLQTF